MRSLNSQFFWTFLLRSTFVTILFTQILAKLSMFASFLKKKVSADAKKPIQAPTDTQISEQPDSGRKRSKKTKANSLSPKKSLLGYIKPIMSEENVDNNDEFDGCEYIDDDYDSGFAKLPSPTVRVYYAPNEQIFATVERMLNVSAKLQWIDLTNITLLIDEISTYIPIKLEPDVLDCYKAQKQPKQSNEHVVLIYRIVHIIEKIMEDFVRSEDFERINSHVVFPLLQCLEISPTFSKVIEEIEQCTTNRVFIEKVFLTLLVQYLANYTGEEESPTKVAQVLAQLIAKGYLCDAAWALSRFVPRYSRVLHTNSMHVLLKCIHIMSGLSDLLGEVFTEKFVVPYLVHFSADFRWMVRKATCEVFVAVARNVSTNVRGNLLAEHYVQLLNDNGRYVSLTAFQYLGQFIATFENPNVTGLHILDGMVQKYQADDKPVIKGTETGKKDSNEQKLMDNANFEQRQLEMLNEHGRLPDGVLLPTQSSPTGTPSPVAVTEEDDVKRGKKRQSRKDAVMDSVKTSFSRVLSTLEKAASSPKGASSKLRSQLSLFGDRGRSIEGKKEEGLKKLSIMSLSVDNISRSSARASVAVSATFAARCSSSEDLSKLTDDEFDDNEAETGTSTTAIAVDLNSSFLATGSEEDLDELLVENGDRVGDAGGDDDDVEMDGTPPSPGLSYWSADMMAELDDDELRPFGAAVTSSEPKTSKDAYMQDRFDVIGTTSMTIDIPTEENDEEWADFGSILHSPLLKTPTGSFNSSSINSDVDTMRLQAEKKLPSQPFVNYDSPTPGTLEHVPEHLYNSYMRIIDPLEEIELDVFRHCAHNFPAVTYTLGVAGWEKLRPLCKSLVYNINSNTREIIASSLHEIARVICPNYVSEVFDYFAFLSQDQEMNVRYAVLHNAAEIASHFSPDRKQLLLEMIPQMIPMPTDPTASRKWRLRSELVTQMFMMCDLYTPIQINEFFAAIALTLANDKVAEVRKSAVRLVARIIGILCTYELPAGGVPDEATDAPLTTALVSDVVAGFGNVKKWTRRQTFTDICDEILAEAALTTDQFEAFFLPKILELVDDQVANIRLSICHVLVHWIQFANRGNNRNNERPADQLVRSAMCRLREDKDRDVRLAAELAAGNRVDLLPMDLTRRNEEMKQKTEAFFEDFTKTLARKSGEIMPEGSATIQTLSSDKCAEKIEETTFPETEDNLNVVDMEVEEQTVNISKAKIEDSSIPEQTPKPSVSYAAISISTNPATEEQMDESDA